MLFFYTLYLIINIAPQETSWHWNFTDNTDKPSSYLPRIVVITLNESRLNWLTEVPLILWQASITLPLYFVDAILSWLGYPSSVWTEQHLMSEHPVQNWPTFTTLFYQVWNTNKANIFILFNFLIFILTRKLLQMQKCNLYIINFKPV